MTIETDYSVLVIKPLKRILPHVFATLHKSYNLKTKSAVLKSKKYQKKPIQHVLAFAYLLITL
jgi:hypothetical protein